MYNILTLRVWHPFSFEDVGPLEWFDQMTESKFLDPLLVGC